MQRFSIEVELLLMVLLDRSPGSSPLLRFFGIYIVGEDIGSHMSAF